MADRSSKITVEPNGPYLVEGGVSLVRKAPVISKFGEPLTWKKGEVLTTRGTYMLCRCGQSKTKPFCDGSHETAGFDGAEAADQNPVANRQKIYEGTKIIMKDDRSLCAHAGFCGTRLTNAWKMTKETDDTHVLSQLIAMIDRCPSGALSYSLEPNEENVEPDLPVEVSVTPDGPLWVTGGIPVERSDGQLLETRNRVTLCRCGFSKSKPLCDGSHKDMGFTAG